MPTQRATFLSPASGKMFKGSIFCLHLFFNWTFYFEIIVESHAIVGNNAARHHILFNPVSRRGNISSNCSIISQSRYWHCCELLILPRVPQLYFVNICLYVSVYLVVCNFIACVGSRIHRLDQNCTITKRILPLQPHSPSICPIP